MVAARVFGVPVVYSEGERAGVLVKMSRSGLFYKTWEGEMLLGEGKGYAVPAIWRFSVADADIAQQVIAAMSNPGAVTVTYTELWRASLAQGDTNFLVTGVAYAPRLEAR